MIPSTIKHVVWDWNGTLLDDVPYCVGLTNAMLKKYNLAPIDESFYRTHFDFPVRTFYETVGFDLQKYSFEELAIEWVQEYYENVRQCRIHKQSLTCIEHLKKAGITQWILSASKRKSLLPVVEHFQLAAFFDEIMGVDDHYGHGKTEVGKTWLHDNGIDRPSVLFIGDTVHDYEVATELSVNCLLVAHGHQSLERLQSCKCTTLENFSLLSEYLAAGNHDKL